MTCKEMERLLSGLIGGDLSDEERGRAEEHLRSCGSCRNAYADLKKSDDLVKRLEDVEPPPWLKTRVMARVREEARERRSIYRKLFFPLHVKVPIQALATVLIAVVAWNVYRTGEPEFRHVAPPPAAVQEAPGARAPSPAADAAIKEERPAVQEKKAYAPPPPAQARREERKAESVRTAARVDAERPTGMPEAARQEPMKDEVASKGAGEARPQEAVRPGAGLASEQKLKAMRSPVGTVAKEAAKRDAAPAAAPMAAASTASRADLDIFLRVRDPASAAAEAEVLLRQIGAQSIDRKDHEGRVTFTAKIRPEQLEDFRGKLRSLGSIRESAPASPRPGSPLAVQLEIRPE